MLITAVEPRRKAMCALYIDGEYVMNLDARTVIENRFDVGREIDDEELHEIIRLRMSAVQRKRLCGLFPIVTTQKRTHRQNQTHL